MSTASPLWRGGHLQEMSPDECRHLMTTRAIGRVLFQDADGPCALPVNYTFDDDTVLFRTTPYSSVALSVRDRTVGFEVDDFDEAHHSGWSVLVRGRAAFVDEPAELTSARPTPWPHGARPLHVRLDVRQLTGRRLLPS